MNHLLQIQNNMQYVFLFYIMSNVKILIKGCINTNKKKNENIFIYEYKNGTEKDQDDLRRMSI
jgi:hypothetical protein